MYRLRPANIVTPPAPQEFATRQDAANWLRLNAEFGNEYLLQYHSYEGWKNLANYKFDSGPLGTVGKES